jgi:hypothetical protein
MLFATLAYADDEVCTAWGDAEAVTIDDVPSEESSGVVALPSDPTVLFTLDDSGGEAELYAFTTDGEFLGTKELRGATNTDWEDIAAGPCPDAVGGEDCLFVGDIGGAGAERNELTIWVIPADTDAYAEATACRLAYPDGETEDAEALLVSGEGVVRVVTKDDDGAEVYKAGVLACGGEVQVMEKEAELALDAAVTGGAMSDDAVILRSLTGAWIWWACPLDWGAEPEALDLGGSPQGEGVAFGEGGALITTSEGDPFRAYRLPCAEKGKLPCACGCGATGGATVPSGLLAWAVAALSARRSRLR